MKEGKRERENTPGVVDWNGGRHCGLLKPGAMLPVHIQVRLPTAAIFGRQGIRGQVTRFPDPICLPVLVTYR